MHVGARLENQTTNNLGLNHRDIHTLSYFQPQIEAYMVSFLPPLLSARVDKEWKMIRYWVTWIMEECYWVSANYASNVTYATYVVANKYAIIGPPL